MKRQKTTDDFVLPQETTFRLSSGAYRNHDFVLPKFVCLFLIINLWLLFAVTTSMAKVEVISILGYVEVRKQQQHYWEVAKRGMALSTEDLVRIPPKATLRVSLESGDAVYFVPGQEKQVKDLAPTEKRRIVDGRTRSSKAADKSRRWVQQTKQSARPFWMTNQHVEFLLSTLEEDANNESVKDFAQRVVEDIPPTTNTGYPSRNIARAQYLFDELRNLKIKPFDNEQPQSIQEIQPPSTTLSTNQGNYLDVTRLYLTLLNAAGVEAKPHGDDNAPLFIVFNSGIAANESQSITVNKKLYFVENDTVWFSIQITPSTDNFIKAWYKGTEIK